METFLNFIQPFRKYIFEAGLVAISLIIVIASGVIYVVNVNAVSKKLPVKKISYTKAPTEASIEQSEAKIVVDISGSVIKPDSYALPENARLKDALQKAGGLSELADKDFFYRNFNLASLLTDQEKIYVPSLTEVTEGIFKENFQLANPQQSDNNSPVGDQSDQESSKISINTASEEDLDSLPGIGPTTAQKIIKSRPYTQLDDLVSKKVVGSAAFDKIKDLITL